MELNEMKAPLECIDDTFGKELALYQWNENQIKAFNDIGRPITLADQYKDMMRDVGFQDIVELKFKWPINGWPKDKKAKQLGLWQQTNLLDGLTGFTFATHTRVLGWVKEEVEVLLAKVRKDLMNKGIHAYFPM